MARGRDYQYQYIDRAKDAQDDWYLQRRKEIGAEDFVQTQLEISQPGDVHEKEADAIGKKIAQGNDQSQVVQNISSSGKSLARKKNKPRFTPELVQYIAWQIVKNEKDVRDTIMSIQRIDESTVEEFFASDGPLRPAAMFEPMDAAGYTRDETVEDGEKTIHIDNTSTLSEAVATYLHEMNHYIDIWLASSEASKENLDVWQARDERHDIPEDNIANPLLLPKTEQQSAVGEKLTVGTRKNFEDRSKSIDKTSDNQLHKKIKRKYRRWKNSPWPWKKSEAKFDADLRLFIDNGALDAYKEWGVTFDDNHKFTSTGVEMGYLFEKQLYHTANPSVPIENWATDYKPWFEQRFAGYMMLPAVLDVLMKFMPIFRKEENDAISQPRVSFGADLASTKGNGQPLEESAKTEMSSKMGVSLDDVSVHTDSNAHQLSESINAKAFTHGQDIYFKSGNYNPSSQSGKELLAHELVHTVQQQNGVHRQIVQRTPDTTSAIEFLKKKLKGNVTSKEAISAYQYVKNLPEDVRLELFKQAEANKESDAYKLLDKIFSELPASVMNDPEFGYFKGLEPSTIEINSRLSDILNDPATWTDVPLLDLIIPIVLQAGFEKEFSETVKAMLKTGLTAEVKAVLSKYGFTDKGYSSTFKQKHTRGRHGFLMTMNLLFRSRPKTIHKGAGAGAYFGWTDKIVMYGFPLPIFQKSWGGSFYGVSFADNERGEKPKRPDRDEFKVDQFDVNKIVPGKNTISMEFDRKKRHLLLNANELLFDGMNFLFTDSTIRIDEGSVLNLRGGLHWSGAETTDQSPNELKAEKITFHNIRYVTQNDTVAIGNVVLNNLKIVVNEPLGKDSELQKIADAIGKVTEFLQQSLFVIVNSTFLTIDKYLENFAGNAGEELKRLIAAATPALSVQISFDSLDISNILTPKNGLVKNISAGSSGISAGLTSLTSYYKGQIEAITELAKLQGRELSDPEKDQIKLFQDKIAAEETLIRDIEALRKKLETIATSDSTQRKPLTDEIKQKEEALKKLRAIDLQINLNSFKVTGIDIKQSIFDIEVLTLNRYYSDMTTWMYRYWREIQDELTKDQKAKIDYYGSRFAENTILADSELKLKKDLTVLKPEMEDERKRILGELRNIRNKISEQVTLELSQVKTGELLSGQPDLMSYVPAAYKFNLAESNLKIGSTISPEQGALANTITGSITSFTANRFRYTTESGSVIESTATAGNNIPISVEGIELNIAEQFDYQTGKRNALIINSLVVNRILCTRASVYQPGKENQPVFALNPGDLIEFKTLTAKNLLLSISDTGTEVLPGTSLKTGTPEKGTFSIESSKIGIAEKPEGSKGIGPQLLSAAAKFLFGNFAGQVGATTGSINLIVEENGKKEIIFDNPELFATSVGSTEKGETTRDTFQRIWQILDPTSNTPLLKADEFRIVIPTAGDDPEYILVKPEFDEIQLKFLTKSTATMFKDKMERGDDFFVSFLNQKSGTLKAKMNGNLRMFKNKEKTAWMLEVQENGGSGKDIELESGVISGLPDKGRGTIGEDTEKKERQLDIFDNFTGQLNLVVFDQVIPIEIAKGGYIDVAEVFNRGYNLVYKAMEKSVLHNYHIIIDQLYESVSNGLVGMVINFTLGLDEFKKNLNTPFDLVRGLSFDTQISKGFLQAIIYHHGKKLSVYNLAKTENGGVDKSGTKVKLSALIEYQTASTPQERKAGTFAEETVKAIMESMGETFHSKSITEWVKEGIDYNPTEQKLKEYAKQWWNDYPLGWTAFTYIWKKATGLFWDQFTPYIAERSLPEMIKQVVSFLGKANIHLDLKGQYNVEDIGGVQIENLKLNLNELLAPQVDVSGLHFPAFTQKMTGASSFSTDGLDIKRGTFTTTDLSFSSWTISLNNAVIKNPKLALPIQKKSVSIASVNDPMESEADNIASKVANGQNADLTGVARFMQGVQRKEKEEEAPLDLLNGIENASGGKNLDDNTRSEMESRMGVDFGGVKIHTGDQANTYNQQVSARAFTYGQNIFFGNGHYNPSTPTGKELLAHELVHTVQQGDGNNKQISRKKIISPPGADPIVDGSMDTEIDIVVDGDADQVKELALTFKRNANEQADQCLLTFYSFNADEEKLPILLTIPGVDWSTFSVKQVQRTDGNVPTIIELRDRPFDATKQPLPQSRIIRIYPPKKQTSQGSYVITYDQTITSISFHDSTFINTLNVMEVVADKDEEIHPPPAFPFIDFRAGVYRDRFRLMVQKNDKLQEDAPAGTYYYKLFVTGLNDNSRGFAFSTFPKFALKKPIEQVEFKLVDSGISFLSFDADGDGVADVTLYTSLIKSFSDFSASEDRKIEFQVYGPSFSPDGDQIVFNKILGRFAFKNGTSLDSYYNRTAVKALPALEAVPVFSSIEAELGSLHAQMEIAYQLAGPINAVDATNFALWQQLSQKMFQLLYVVSSAPDSPERDLFIAETAALAFQFYNAFKAEVSGVPDSNAVETVHVLGTTATDNKYTKESTISGEAARTESELLLDYHVTKKEWSFVQADFYSLSAGYNLWIADRISVKDPSKQGLSEQIRSASGQLDAIAELRGSADNTNITRVRAVYFALHGLGENVSNMLPIQLPLYYYYDKKEHEWVIVDLIRTENPFEVRQSMDDTYVPGPTDEPPIELFQEFNHDEHLPDGIIYFQLQSGKNGSVKIDEGSDIDLTEILGYAALVAAAVGLVIMSGGTAAPAVAACFYISAGLTIASAVLDTYDAMEHGQLTNTRLMLNMLDIATSLLQLKLTQLGKIAMMEKIGGVGLTAAQKGIYFNLQVATTTMGGAQLGIIGYDSWTQIEAINAGPGTDDAKKRAVATLLSKFIITGSFWVLDLRGTAASADFGPNASTLPEINVTEGVNRLNGKKFRLALPPDLDINNSGSMRITECLNFAGLDQAQMMGLTGDPILHLQAADLHMQNGNMNMAIASFDEFRSASAALNITPEQFEKIENGFATLHVMPTPKEYRTGILNTTNKFILKNKGIVKTYVSWGPKMTSDEFNNLSVNGKVDPHKLRYSQDYVNDRYKNGKTIEETANEIQTNALQISVEPVEIISYIKGQDVSFDKYLSNTGVILENGVYSIDNRRVVSHQMANTPIEYIKLDQVPKNKYSHFSTKNSGMFIDINYQ